MLVLLVLVMPRLAQGNIVLLTVAELGETVDEPFNEAVGVLQEISFDFEAEI